MAVTRRSVLCPCGGDIYESTYANSQPVWRCDNCSATTPRTKRHRKTNHSRAHEAFVALRDQWKPVDDQLSALIAAGKAKSGALLVHSSTFNHHMNKLLDLEHPTNFEVTYHTARAREDFSRAQAFVSDFSQGDQ